MLPKELSWTERFKLARDVGFEEVECNTAADDAEAGQIKAAAERTGLRVHSVMNSAHGKYPLSSPDPAVVAAGIKGLETSLGNARLWGSETVLLVAGFVTPQVGYKECWERSQKEIRRILPRAAELKVTIAIENVGSRFLLSPLEFARYVDEFNSPWLRAYFDVGNIVRNGFPQDWIRTLGKRIVKLHLKDPAVARQTPAAPAAPRAPLLEGDVDWREVHKALTEIGYRGSATVELPGGDAEYLRDVSRRVDKILAGV
jgi:hexulose-6-phosphate isomerase